MSTRDICYNAVIEIKMISFDYLQRLPTVKIVLKLTSLEKVGKVVPIKFV